MKITKIYEAITSAFGIVMDENRQLHWTCGMPVKDAKSLIKVTLREKKATLPIVMPDKNILRQDEDFKAIKFNPMAESFMAVSPPEVVQRLVVDAGTRVAVSMSGIMNALLEYSLNQDLHATADPAIFELIKDVPTINKDTTAKNIHKYVTAVLGLHNGAVGKNALGRFKLEKAVSHEGKTYAYGCRYIPVFEKHIGQAKVLGVKRPNQNAGLVLDNIIRQVIKPVLAISDTKTAPSFTVLLTAFDMMAKHLNRLATLLKLDADPLAYIDFKMPDMEEMYKLYVKEMRIPFPGNVGVLDPALAVAEDQQQEEVLENAEPVVAAAPEPTVTTSEPVVETKQPEKPKVNYDPNQPYAWLNKNDTAQATAAPVQSPQSSTPNTVDLSPKKSETATATPSTGLAVKKNPLNEMVHLKDATGRPLVNVDGSPFLIDKKDVPSKPVMQEMNGHMPLFNQQTGAPMLIEAPAANAPGMLPPGTVTNGIPGQPNATVNPNDPYSAYRQGKTAQMMAAANPYMQPPGIPNGMPYAQPNGYVHPMPGQYNPYAQPAYNQAQPSYNQAVNNYNPYGQPAQGQYNPYGQPANGQYNPYNQPVNTVAVDPNRPYH
ncbi:hypothetical protein [Vibrio phage BONAISHI]|nr:hypothetical protein [Vibrio phage BONAISHI]